MNTSVIHNENKIVTKDNLKRNIKILTACCKLFIILSDNTTEDARNTLGIVVRRWWKFRRFMQVLIDENKIEIEKTQNSEILNLIISGNNLMQVAQSPWAKANIKALPERIEFFNKAKTSISQLDFTELFALVSQKQPTPTVAKKAVVKRLTSEERKIKEDVEQKEKDKKRKKKLAIANKKKIETDARKKRYADGLLKFELYVKPDKSEAAKNMIQTKRVQTPKFTSNLHKPKTIKETTT